VSQPEILQRIRSRSSISTASADWMKIAVERGRSTRADLKIGNLRRTRRRAGFVKFCHKIGLNYVSCSPFRVPIARLAAAQAGTGHRPSN